MTAWRLKSYSLRTLLLVPVMFGGIWWWSTWPDRTANSFVTHLANHDMANVRQMLGLSPKDGLPLFAADDHPWGISADFGLPQFQRRSSIDWLLARGGFSIDASHASDRFRHCGFFVSRGAIRYSGVLAGPNETQIDPELNLAIDPFQLQFISASDVLRELAKTDSDVPVTIGRGDDHATLFVLGPPAAVAKIRARLAELDKPERK